MDENTKEIKEQIEDVECMISGRPLDWVHKERRWHARQRNCRYALVCLTLILCTLIVCCTYAALTVYREQQYALNMQYSGLLDYVNGATIMETGENGIIIDGDSNKASSQGDITDGEED